jgi:hypothetical protein
VVAVYARGTTGENGKWNQEGDVAAPFSATCMPIFLLSEASDIEDYAVGVVEVREGWGVLIARYSSFHIVRTVPVEPNRGVNKPHERPPIDMKTTVRGLAGASDAKRSLTGH